MSNYLKSILKAFYDLLFVFTKDGIIADYLTSNHEDELLESRETFLGKHHREVLPPDVSTQIEKAINKIAQGESHYIFDYSLEIKGNKQWYTAVLSEIEFKEETRYLGAVRNITERKNQELLLREVLNTAPGAIVVLDPIKDSDGSIIDFNITHVNKAIVEQTGATEEELTGQKLSIFIPGNTKEELWNHFKTVLSTGRSVEFQYQYDDNNIDIWYHSKVVKYNNGLVSTFMDITEQKKNEELLVKTNEELKELNRQKDKLFSVISHDLRNAISGTYGLYDLIFEDYESLTKEEIYTYLKLLKNSSKSSNELLEDLLLWSKNQFQEVSVSPEKLNLSEILSSVFKSKKSNAIEKRIELNNRVPDDIFVNADVNMVKTILRNLVSNGIKFSHEGGNMDVSAIRKNGIVEISVTDEGIGMEKDVLEKILNKKSNYTTPGTKGEKGSGLGLDLVIDFVEKHDGKIWADSTPGKGSTFTFTLPGYS